jgi:hypothetical protein
VGYPQNAYPNQINFPEVSFPQELIPPDVDPDDPDLEMILVEYNPAWTKVLMAACDQLTQFSSWQGEHDDKILAVNRAIILKWLLQKPVDVGEEDFPAPYWDSDEDVDDEMPAEEQEWYGMVTNPAAPADELTFVENAVIWIITGFIALVLVPALPAGVAAGLAFRTLATRFTLAFRRGDIIEQIRIVIDAKDYGTVDTSTVAEGEIIEIDVNGLDEADFHDILLVVTNP